MRALSAAALACAGTPAAPAEAPAWPRIVEIRFEGNDTTQAKTLLREMLVRVGDPAEPGRIERSRQAVQDLGLFRSVEAKTQEVEGGVRLLLSLREKYYLIPAPRVDANSDGQYAYGLQLRWYNAWGLNHTIRATFKQSERRAAGRGQISQLDASYAAPFVLDSPLGLEGSYRHITQPVEDPATYDEVRDYARFVLTRAFGKPGEPASQGWRLGSGLQWQRQDTRGAGAPPPQGQATALVLNTAYNGQHFNLYSEQGPRFGLELEGAAAALGSDYDYSSATANYENSWYVGSVPHQSLGVFAEGGVYDGGPAGAGDAYAVGGSDNLRGYRLNFRSGDNYYYTGIEYLRPLHWDWLRGTVFIETGDAFGGKNGAGSYTDIGLGLRLRLPWFVRVELNAGMAWPVGEVGKDAGGRFFATGRR